MPDRKPKPQSSESHPPKTCAACGRTITWRRKWERDWDNVKFCSDACRSHKPGARDAALEATILKLLHHRGAGKTICPSDAARTVAGEGVLSKEPAAWEPLMEPARAAARRLVAAGTIVITQGVQVFINYSNDVLLQNYNAPMYVTLIQHGQPIGTPATLHCIAYTLCLMDADIATLIPATNPTTPQSMSSKLVEFTDSQGRDTIVTLH